MLSRLPRLSVALTTSRIWSHNPCPPAPPFQALLRSLNTLPNMSQVTDADIIQRFEKLSLSKPEIINHAPVKNGAEWKAELEKIGKGSASLTKTVCRAYMLSSLMIFDCRLTLLV